jgi:hypothetical protein
VARPMKQGLSYFPIDVDFLRDIKTRKIKRACGAQSVSVLIALLSSIYQNDGYYLKWDDDQVFLIAEDAEVKEGAVQEVVQCAIRVGFFDTAMYEKHRILTSPGIQKRYYGIVSVSKRKRIHINRDFALISELMSLTMEETELIPEFTELIQEETPQSKVKQSKVKQSKGKETPPAPLPFLSENVKSEAEAMLGIISPGDYKTLCDFSRLYSEEWVLSALRIARERDRPTLQYTRGILQSWAKQGGMDAPRKLQRDKTAQEVMAETIAAMREGRMA